MVEKRHLTEEERKLWEYITRYDKPIKNTVRNTEKITASSNRKTAKTNNDGIISNKQKTSESSIAITDNAKVTTSKNNIKSGDYRNIDRNTAEKFQSGKFPVEAKLDLHGLDSDRAFILLKNFIIKHKEKGSRFLVVITGKGSGVLRDSLPKWLNTPHLQKFILAFDTAKEKHGGNGAYYILLKRNRKIINN